MSASSTFTPLRTVTATRYVTPLREGGSLPALVEADDDGLYVLKFRGAGQGPKALVAELVGGEIARAARAARPRDRAHRPRSGDGARRARPGDPGPHPRQRGDQRRRSTTYPGSLPFVPHTSEDPDPVFAADVVWLDALPHQRRPHAPQPEPPALARQRVAHRPRRGALPPARAGWTRCCTRGGRSRRSPTTSCCRTRDRSSRPTRGSRRGCREARIAEVVGAVPEAWVEGTGHAAYVEYLTRRLAAPRLFPEEADAVRS